MNLQKAIEIATKAHEGQKRWGGEPYITHPEEVASKFPYSEELQIVAWLHDVIEDTPTTLSDLKTSGFSDAIIQAVDAITKQENEPYSAYIQRVADNYYASQVKLADLAHNLETIKPGSMCDKYQLAMCYIQDVQKLEEEIEGLYSDRAGEDW